MSLSKTNLRKTESLLQAGADSIKARDYETAIETLHEVLRINPNDDLALWLISYAFFISDFVESSAEYAIKALRINPKLRHLRIFLSYYCYEIKKKYSEAISLIKEELGLYPDSNMAYCTLAVYHSAFGDIHSALRLTQKQLEISPNDRTSYDNMLMFLHYCPGVRPQEIMRIADNYYQSVFANNTQKFSFEHLDLNPEKPILRVGFVSGDFRGHVVFYYLKDLFKRLAQKNIEVYAYCNNHEDHVTEQLKTQVKTWHQINQKNTADVIKLIKNDQIDVLVDLSGHSHLNRLDLFAHKPSPLQITWLGQSGPLGLPQIDYMLSTRYLVLDGEEAHHNEKVYFLPKTYASFYPPEQELQLTAPPCINNGFVTFGSFNSTIKINEEVLNLWSRILNAVENSRLIFKAKIFLEDSSKERFYTFFEDRGISRERISLEPFDDRGGYLPVYNRVDIALDPFPFTGGTTTNDALYMSTPVVTLYGERMSHRSSAGYLNICAYDELIAKSQDEYFQIAVDLARDISRIQDYKQNIRQRYLESAICDVEAFAEDFASAIRDMWTQVCSGKVKI